MKKVSFLFFIFLLAIVVAGCSDSASKAEEKEVSKITVSHELGETKVTKNPETVVVFDYSSLETLTELGVDVASVPKSSLPDHLSQYNDDAYEDAGGIKEPDLEKISEIAPDLIIISGRQADYYDELKKLAPTIYLALDTENIIESFKENTTILGEIFDKEDKVAEALAEIDDEIAALKEEVTSTEKNALVILANEGNISAYGNGSRFGHIYEAFGFTAVDPNIEVSTHGQSVSFEYIVEKNPDYLFVVDRDAVVGGEASAKGTVENDLIKTTTAYKEDNIIYLDPNYWYLAGGGLMSLHEMIGEVQAAATGQEK